MTRSLVLNASFEPLSVVSHRRAVCLVLAEKAEVIHECDRSFKSERQVVAVPSVARLRYYVRVPYRRAAALSRKGVFVRDGHRCQYCGARADSIDHIIPRSRGGEHIWENVVAACRRCNAEKRDEMLHQTALRLGRAPVAPPSATWIAATLGAIPDDWRAYLRPAQISA